MKGFRKSVNFWQIYRHQLVVHFLGTQCTTVAGVKCLAVAVAALNDHVSVS